MVSSPRNFARFTTLLLPRGYLVNWLHICGNGHTETIVPRRFRNRSTVSHVQVLHSDYCVSYLYFTQSFIFFFLSFSSSRILKTPTEDIWPGVTSLPDYKESFPCWTQKQLREQVKVIDSAGYDLLDQMLTYNPVHRISAKRILEHKFFEGFDKQLVPTN